MVDKGQMMMLAGIWLKQGNDSITPLELQKEVSLMAENGFNPSLIEAKMALEMLKIGGFLEEIEGIYYPSYVVNVKDTPVKYKQAEKIGMNSLQNPLWSPGI